MKPLYLTVAALGLIAGGLAAHAQTEAPTETQQAEPAASGTAAEPAGGTAGEAAEDYGVDTPLAVVDGTPLTLGELIAIRRELPEQYQQLPSEVLYSGILEQMIDQMLLAEAAREAGLDQRPAVEMNLLNQQRAILADAYLRAETEMRVTPEAVEALYNERYVEGEPEEEVRAAHILVETEEKAKELKAELEAGADFAELAEEHGTDGTASRGGDLGWFTRGDMVPEFADAAFAMEAGTVSDPVKTAFGWHLIKLEERRDREPPALEQVRGELAQELTRKAQLEAIEALRAEADIDMPEDPVPPEAIRADEMLDAAE